MGVESDKYKNAEVSLDESIVRNLRFCSKYLRHHSEGKGSQRRVLYIIRKYGTISQRDLLGKLDIRPSSLSEILSKLEGQGYIQKTRSEADKRNFDVSITPEGLEALDVMQAHYLTNITQLL